MMKSQHCTISDDEVTALYHFCFAVEFNAIVEHHNVINHISVSICDELYSDDYVW